jgi:hypothetical protein
MVQFSRFSRSALAAGGALFALFGGEISARADDPLTNLGPVGPSEPILARFGNQRLIAFFVPERDKCSVSTVTWKETSADAPYASVRVRLSMKPGQMVELDVAQRQSIGLVCGADASSLAATAPAELILTGATEKN